VEISYAILEKSVLELLPADNVPLEETLYPRLAKRRQLLAYWTDHRYYSVGSHRRLPLTEAFFGGGPAILLDRDGVLNRKPPRGCYVQAPDEFEWLPGALRALRLLNAGGYRVIVVSNQAGIGRGMLSEDAVLRIHERMVAEASRAGGQIDAVYYCPHDWDEGCECRKPSPGLLFRAQREHSLNLSRTFFVGDDERDAQAADAAGCPSILVSDGVSLMDIVRTLLGAAA
jgi:D-glycero-D-manno-heptose 1,7-bisphosphate phosphatase